MTFLTRIFHGYKKKKKEETRGHLALMCSDNVRTRGQGERVVSICALQIRRHLER